MSAVVMHAVFGSSLNFHGLLIFVLANDSNHPAAASDFVKRENRTTAARRALLCYVHFRFGLLRLLGGAFAIALIFDAHSSVSGSPIALL